ERGRERRASTYATRTSRRLRSAAEVATAQGEDTESMSTNTYGNHLYRNHREGRRSLRVILPELDVASQGATVEKATTNLRVAVELFLESASPEEIKQRLHAEVFVTRFEAAHG